MAREQAERRKTAQLMFDLGQKAYGKGAYGRSIEFLEGALTIIPRLTLFGGEVGSVPRMKSCVLDKIGFKFSTCGKFDLLFLLAEF